jgi:hypothetical protein
VSAGVEFPAEAVARHAGEVGQASDEMAQARSAVGQIVMDSAAYGELCQFLPALLSPLFGSATEVMNDAVEALGETSLKLRATSSDMTVTDVDSARRLNAAGPASLDLPL